jgi:hypothetical protein
MNAKRALGCIVIGVSEEEAYSTVELTVVVQTLRAQVMT